MAVSKLQAHLEKAGFRIDKVDAAATLPDALQLHINEHYDLCFLNDELPQQHLETFIKDYGKLERGESCVFAQLRDSVGSDFNRTSLRPIGFTTVVSRQIDQADKVALEYALQLRGRYVEVQRRVANVEKAVEVLIKEIDRLSKQKQRGKQGILKAIASRFIAEQTSYDQEILQRYYTELIEKTANISAPKATKISVPEEVLKHQLPGLKKDGYDGASDRVWDKLVKAFGLKRTSAVPLEDRPAKPSSEE